MSAPAIASVPPGRYAVGVSGGADSVALLLLAGARADLALHVVHLDHQTRGADSTADAAFVADLAQRLGVPYTIARRDELESTVGSLPSNPSARYRMLRLALFARAVRAQALDGVLLAHHADDQAETVLLRLLRGSGPAGLVGMRRQATVAGVRLLRPLLDVRAADLRRYLRDRDQSWREDASNQSDRYARNRARRLLEALPELVGPLLQVAAAAADLRDWTDRCAPALPEAFPAGALYDWPALLQQHAARRWLRARGCPPGDLRPPVIARLLAMVDDAATAARQDFPGRLRVRRRGGIISTAE